MDFLKFFFHFVKRYLMIKTYKTKFTRLDLKFALQRATCTQMHTPLVQLIIMLSFFSFYFHFKQLLYSAVRSIRTHTQKASSK